MPRRVASSLVFIGYSMLLTGLLAVDVTDTGFRIWWPIALGIVLVHHLLASVLDRATGGSPWISL